VNEEAPKDPDTRDQAIARFSGWVDDLQDTEIKSGFLRSLNDLLLDAFIAGWNARGEQGPA
jgi:hypothetical protein